MDDGRRDQRGDACTLDASQGVDDPVEALPGKDDRQKLALPRFEDLGQRVVLDRLGPLDCRLDDVTLTGITGAHSATRGFWGVD